MSKSRYFTYADKARAAAKNGENVHFAHGLGYYLVAPGASPAPPIGPGPAEPKSGFGADPYTGLPKRAAATPTDPHSVPTRPQPPTPPMGPLTPQQIQEQAGLIAQGQLTPQQEEVRRQQALAAQQARADERAIQGFQGASAQILAGIAPQVGAGYQRAADAEAQYGQGLATGVSQDVADRVAADKAFMESQGQSGGSGPDTAALHDSVYALGGQIPGDTFAEQGAAAQAYAAQLPAISLNAGREQIDARMAQARTDNDQYAQQLLQIAAQYPGLKAQALQQLNQYEIDKATYRENVLNDKANRKHVAASDALSARSERAQEIAAGISQKQAADESTYKWASLEFQTQKAQVAAENAQARIAASGRKVNAAASKNVGYVVDNNGHPILDDSGKRIPVKQSEALKNRDDATSKARKTAFDFATKLRGNPVKAPKGSRGVYVAGPGQKYGVPGGVFPPAYPGAPATTDDPEKAARQGDASGYADAQQKVWAEIDGDGLVSRYGYSREQVMAYVNDALKRAGWKRK